MDLYRLHVKSGIEEPEDWTRVLIPFAGNGLRLVEEFKRDCVIEAGPILIKEIMSHLQDVVELFHYESHEREFLRQRSNRDEEEDL